MMNEKASERQKDLLELNRQMHDKLSEGFNGQSLVPVICQIGVLLQQYACKSVLDYGCGRGDAQMFFRVDALWGVDYKGYDPAVKRFENLPEGKFDAVICTDVLEHIPEEDLIDWVIDEIFSKANKFVFIKVPTWLASKTLPNGENVHCTIKPKEWWTELLQSYSVKYAIPTYVVITSLPDGSDHS